MTLHVSDMRVIAAEAQALVEDLQEDTKDGVAAVTAISLAVDVEQQHIRFGGDGALDISGEHRVGDFALKKIDGLARDGVLADLFVFQQVGKDLQEVRFTRTEETGDPHPYSPRRILGAVQGSQVAFKKAAQMLIQLAGDDVLIQLLPDGLSVILVSLDHAVDRAVNGAGKQILDLHGGHPVQLTSRKAR